MFPGPGYSAVLEPAHSDFTRFQKTKLKLWPVEMERKTRCVNFGAGPAQIPAAVLEEAQKSLSNWKGTGASIAE